MSGIAEYPNRVLLGTLLVKPDIWCKLEMYTSFTPDPAKTYLF
jgi:hypothetical protein